jgi:uncharacterized peroxidase-related enzyme
MEQRRRTQTAGWYHETQRSLHGGLPLDPHADTHRDRFLLGIDAYANASLRRALEGRKDVFDVSLAAYRVFFPESVKVSREVTLSLYDRLSTALTVAQVTGVQTLCSHYAARLTPLPSPDASRQSNVRLTQITQYARQLASQPTLITRHGLQQLLEVGLSVADIVTFTQIIGFVSYQARVITGISALAGRPVAVIPAFPAVDDAPAENFPPPSSAWVSHLPPVQTTEATPLQLDILDQSHPDARLLPYYLLLAHDAAALREQSGIVNGILYAEAGLKDSQRELAALVVSRINGCGESANTHAEDFLQLTADRLTVNRLWLGVPDAMAVDNTDNQQQQRLIIHLVATLTRSPERFGPQDLQPLLAEGFSIAEILDVILATALTGWTNRLMQTLGSTGTPTLQ